MIEKNVVLIETLDNIGTGVLYPCIYKGKEVVKDKNAGNSYILITNHHVLGYHSKENIQKSISLTFYDDWGTRIVQNDICTIKLFELKDNENQVEEDELVKWDRTRDIVALLIVLKRGIQLTLSTGVLFEELKNREKIYVEGYPGVLSEQEVSQRIQLEGMQKAIFPSNDKVGAYQITDDYHWYNNLEDRDLLEGLSGSPVFMKRDGKEFLLGINQSIANVDDGKNPFKIVYFLRVEHILNYLRGKNCIIYRKISENKIRIEWIYEENKVYENDITILMIGGSGAGKSSVAKKFAFHGNVIDSTNDGQTTRTDIIYQYSINEKEPKADVCFLNQKKFVEHMMAHIDMYPFAMCMEKAFNLDRNFVSDEKKLMRNFYQILCLIKEDEEDRRYAETKKDILNCLEDELINDEKIKLYDALLNIFLNSKYSPILKYILDENEANDARKKILYGGKEDAENIPQIVIDTIRESENEKFEFEKYRKLVVELASKNKKCTTDICYDWLQDKEFKSNYNGLILHCEGFFDIEEFKFILSKEDEEDIENIKKAEEKWREFEYEDEYTEDMNDTQIDCKKGWKVYQDLVGFYKEIYRIIKTAIKRKYPFMEESIRLDSITRQEREFLSKCLQVSKEGSLTGMIDNVKIWDKISNEYAFILREFEINYLTLVDTCGLDHIATNSQKDIIRRLNGYHYDMNSDKSIWYNSRNRKGDKIQEDKKVAVLFVKKLDAGKPDELRNILPCIRKTIPKAPVYCCFTGVDIFYRSKREIKSLDWTMISNQCPKVVKYILGDNSELKQYMSDIQYLVLKNNLIPFCGEPNRVKEQFSYAESNYQYVRKLIASISMKESSSLEIVETKGGIENRLESVVFEIIKNFFENASLEADDFRWNTINADIMSGYKGKLGYSYTYEHCFFQIFHKAYVETIGNVAQKALKENNIDSIEAIQSAMYEMEAKFLGSNENLYKVELEEEKKNDFRKVLEKMYQYKEPDGKLLFKYNFFDKSTYENVILPGQKKINKEIRNEFFDCVFGFKKGLELRIDYNRTTDTVQRHITNIFLQILVKQIEDDNRKKADNIVRVSENYYEELQNIEKSFMQKYGMNDNGKFIDLMIRFFENQKEQ